MNEMMREGDLSIAEGQALLASIKARVAELEFPDTKNWSSIDRAVFSATGRGLARYLQEDGHTEKASLERSVEALLLMVKSGFWLPTNCLYDR